MAEAYDRSFKLAFTEFESNQVFQCGYARWTKCDDALYEAALQCGLNPVRVTSSNTQEHTEIRLPECTLIMKKVDHPGKVGKAAYRQPLLKNQGLLSLFSSDEMRSKKIDQGKPVLLEITHGPKKGAPGEIGFIHVAFPNGTGGVYTHFPIKQLTEKTAPTQKGVEVVPPLQPILPKSHKLSVLTK